MEKKNLADIEFLLPTSKVKVNLSCIRLHVEKCVIAYLRKLLECGIASQESVKVLNPNVTEKNDILHLHTGWKYFALEMQYISN